MIEIPFKTLIAEDISFHNDSKKISKDNVRPECIAVPMDFLDENYLLKTFIQAMQMKGIKEWSVFE